MSQDNPPLLEILRTVREFIDDITPRLEGQDRYHGLCASHLLAIAERELDEGPGIDAAEAAALASFGVTDEPLPEAWAALGRGIRAGRHDARWDALLELLLAHTINRVRVTRPDQLHPMHRADGAAPESS
jgi:hypothetical protein